jgi:hypothetical protein
MKLKVKEKIKPGTERIVKRFAFFPITEWIPRHCNTSFKRGQTIWLETVYIKQRRVEGIGGELGGIPDSWDNREFVTKKEYDDFKNLKDESKNT